MSCRDREFQVLRETIALRGTVRMALLPLTLLGWGLLAGGLIVFSEWPIAAVVSLLVLAGGFEAIHALHVGAERIGRYIQVYYESNADGPLWESTAMRLGPGLPGGGIDPLFTVLFITAALANLVVVFIPPPAPIDAVVPIAVHSVFVIRVVRARLAAARQRARDLEMFQALHGGGDAAPSPTR